MPTTSQPLDPQSTARQREWLKRAVALWLILAVAASIKAAVQPSQHTVYPVLARGARNWWSDTSLYLTYTDVDLFRYSPTWAVAMTPFGLLPDRLGGIVWVWANVLAMLVAMRVFVRHVLPGSWPPKREALLLAMTLAGSARGIWAGQSNAILIASAMLGLAAVVRGRWWTAALLLAVPVFIKVWPAALVLLVAACWPRQLVGRIVVVMGLLAAAPLVTRPRETVVWQYGEWVSMLNSTQIERWQGYRDGWTVWEFFQFPVDRNLYEIVQCETALAVLGWCLWQRGRVHARTHAAGSRSKAPRIRRACKHAPYESAPNVNSWWAGAAIVPPCEAAVRRLLTSIFSIWLAWQLVFGPGSERLTYLIIAPAISWAVLESWQSKRLRGLAVAAWLLVTLLSMGAVERVLLKLTPLAPALLPLGVVAFAAWVVLHEASRPGAAEEVPSHRGVGARTHAAKVAA